MALRGEVIGQRAQQAHQQKHRADNHVKAVKSGRHEKCGTVNMAGKPERRMLIFIGLKNREQRPQSDSQHQPPFQPFAVAMLQRMVGPSNGGAGCQQNQRVDKRQVPWIKSLNTVGRPVPARQFGTRSLNCLARIEAGVKISPEPGDEEHHLGGNEQNHAVAMMQLNHRCVVAAMGLIDNIAPPRQHGIQNPGQPDNHDPRRV